jgi:hypothetical protein
VLQAHRRLERDLRSAHGEQPVAGGQLQLALAAEKSVEESHRGED